jgi:hypothetical protein
MQPSCSNRPTHNGLLRRPFIRMVALRQRVISEHEGAMLRDIAEFDHTEA